MRVLTASEILQVAGAAGECEADGGGNNYGGITETSSVGDDLIELYEGLVAVTSHIIERVASAL